MKKWSVFGGLILLALFTRGQRTYGGSSVLASGQWLKLSVSAPGVYKLSAQQIKNAGLTLGISSEKIRLFGTGGAELPESNASHVQDDLPEISIEMNDGGDGIFDASDFILFYSPGPHQWFYDNLKGKFIFRKNHYSNKSYYYLQLSDKPGRRIFNAASFTDPSVQVNSFYEHYRYELDSINFLKSGKEWYGEDFSNQAGRKSSREFQIPFPVVPGKIVRIVSDLVGRGFGQVNRVAVSLNGNTIMEQQTLPMLGNILEPAANPSQQEAVTIPQANSITLRYQFNGSGVNAEGWLNWFEVHGSRNLDMAGQQVFHFRDTFVQPSGVKVEYRLSNPAVNTFIWDISNPLTPQKINSLAGNPLRFVQDVTRVREYVAFDGNQLMSPGLEGLVVNQNLHGAGSHDMIIVAEKQLLDEANRLAAFHQQKQGLKVLVTETGKIFNEFSSGTPDPSAIRNFIKMLYDRAGGDPALRPKFLLLFGAASYIQNESRSGFKNRVPSYQSSSSLDPLTSYVTDDYFGFLDDHEDVNTNFPPPLLDIAIGRIPARSLTEAKTVVNKIFSYYDTASFGSWKNNISLVADDEDFNIHLGDAELHASSITTRSAAWNIQKFYLDAYPQEAGTAGSFYPGVNSAITKDINRGTLVWNYSGHGGSSRLAQESILDKNMIAAWENSNRLPLFITATCDFAPFDDQSQYSIGEELLMARATGAIGLMTTTRLVFASSNRVINNNFIKSFLSRDAQGKISHLGNALKEAKNLTVQNTGDFINARKFVMLGDPAMKPGIPEFTVRTTAINGKPIGNLPDTLKSLSNYEFAGEILRADGSLASDFNGNVFPSIYDKPRVLSTLGNDPQSQRVEFLDAPPVLYSGKVRAINGRFSFKFITPGDMNLATGRGRISYYAQNEKYDAAGGSNDLVTGGFGNSATNDQKGPVISGYLDSITFKNGDLVSPSPLLFLEVSDASGINLTGSLGHEIIAIIDGNPSSAINLNDFFTPTNSNQSGNIKIRLPTLPDGFHTVTIRAWDIFNNSNTLTIGFRIASPQSVTITKLSCIPNPVRETAIIQADLNGPTKNASLELTLFTIGGQLIRSFNRTINEPSLRSISIEWDGKDERGNSLGIGTYVYVIRIKTKDGFWTQKTERLIVL
jgi:hypothetical protein